MKIFKSNNNFYNQHKNLKIKLWQTFSNLKANPKQNISKLKTKKINLKVCKVLGKKKYKNK